MSPAEYTLRNLRGSNEFDFRESAASLLAKSAEICGCRSHMLLRACRKRNPKKGAFFGSVGNRWRACSRTRRDKSGQI